MAIIGFAVVPFILIGCSLSIPSTLIYNLYIPSKTEIKINAGNNTNQTLSITIQSPNYLSQPYIAYRDSQYKVESSKYARWDISPDKLVSEEFRYKISKMGVFEKVTVAAFNPSKYLNNSEGMFLNIYLKRFERIDEREISYAELDFDYEITLPDGLKPIYTASFYRKIKIADKSYIELAKGLSSGIDEGIGEVMGKLINRKYYE
jgi:uncharacterized lipoprotein YmbA